MASEKIWDAKDVALIIIDYQEEMFRRFKSSDPRIIELNIKLLINAARAFNIPIILSTVGVKMGVNQPTRSSIKNLLPDVQEIDRTGMDAWEDESFRNAVAKTGKKKLIFCALYTEICLAFPVVEALANGYEVTFPTDAVAGLTLTAHNTAIQRLIQAGAVPNTSLALLTELFRDWKSDLAKLARPLFVQYLSDYDEIVQEYTYKARSIDELGEARFEH